ncbi:3'-5' exoribonuclease YhaM [Salisediminibacterium selenitireducens]|uniref:Metal dependent phosphohydrolase n=1 Tax=Bacillus selenitireducens (strain ATCC 700615 / DSM 15326 / MLS10) TaxID=439292 RepID=D6XX16_BACIE|nr:3'-5' exoribonuclease YhaM [Salisediminibacterium selenitireducens]ADH99992.1 metal dependent phosphohydrolase [[Bacillus] selenitireducens MLS10]
MTKQNGIQQKLVGDTVESFMLIKSVKKGIASNGKPFLSLQLSDRTGEIDAKLWAVSPEDQESYQAGRVVFVNGDIQDFRGMRQLRIRSLRLSVSSDQVKPHDFMPSAPMAPEDMIEEVTQFIFELQNARIQRITRHLFKKHQKAFATAPAAVKNHHEYASGLLYHVVSMLRLGRELSALYPTLDTDLLYSGIILHDMAKVRELSGPLTPEYTVEGKLLGHIPLMITEIDEAAKELQIEGDEVLALQHMILTHHGKPEWGSPKPPMIREAEMLHMIDNIDARMNMLDRALETVPPGQFSERVFPLENRSFYKPDFQS